MESKLIRLNDFLFTASMDNLNIFKASTQHAGNMGHSIQCVC